MPGESVRVFGDVGKSVTLVLRNSAGAVIIERSATITAGGEELSWSDAAQDVYSVELRHVDDDGDVIVHDAIWRLPILRSEVGSRIVEIDRLPNTGTTAQLSLFDDLDALIETVPNVGGTATFTSPLTVGQRVTATINQTPKSFTIRDFAITGSMDQEISGSGPAGAVVYGDLVDSNSPDSMTSEQGLVGEDNLWTLDFASPGFDAVAVDGEIGVWDLDGDQLYLTLDNDAFDPV